MPKVALGALVVLAAALIVASVWWLTPREPEVQMVLPELSELPAGPRAPHTRGLGVRVGRTTLDEVRNLIRAQGTPCRDVSPLALIEAAERRRAAMKRTEAPKDASVDALGGPSAHGEAPHGRNPQVRLSCEGALSSAIPDYERPLVRGRWLFVFDSAAHPLRHVSFRRQHTSSASAAVDYETARRAMAEAYGPATTQTGALPEPDRAKALVLPKLQPVKEEWVYADLHTRVQITNFGRRGIDVLESLEVPWPVRSDAPTLPTPP